MSESSKLKSPTSRLISLMYWTVWGYLALAVGTCFAAATWIMPRHGALLAAVGVVVCTACGTAALIYLVRSYRHSGRRWLPRMIKALGLLPILAAGAVTMRIAWLSLMSFQLTARPGGRAFSEWQALKRAHTVWGWRFEAYQLVVLLVIAAVVVALGWPLARLLRPRMTVQHTYRRRLFASYCLACLVPLLLVLGGFEWSRHGGMVAFVFAYGEQMRTRAAARPLMRGAKTRGALGCAEVGDSLAVVELKGLYATWGGAGGLRYGRYTVFCNRAIKFPHHGAGRISSSLRYTISPIGNEHRVIWGEWQEMGPSLTFSLSPRMRSRRDQRGSVIH